MECSSSTEISILICRICGSEGHGNHFGTITCRACAAFFRRFAGTTGKRLECRTTRNQCSHDGTGKWYCKKCRFIKCLQNGMNEGNIQSDRDPFSSVDNFYSDRNRKRLLQMKVVPESMENYLGRPNLMIRLEPDRAAVKKYVLDVSDLLFKVSDVMNQKPKYDRNISNMSDLHRLVYGLTQLRKSQQADFVELRMKDKDEYFWYLEYQMINVAKWLSYSKEFQQLSLSNQMKIFKRMWTSWTRLERMAMNVQMRGEQIQHDKMFMNTNQTVISMEPQRVDCSWFTNYSCDQVKFLMEPYDPEIGEDLFIPLMQTNPNDVELTFMLFQMSFHLAGKRLDQTLSGTIERMIEGLANDLHEYYTKEAHLPIYSHRLAKLMKVNHSFEKYHFKRMEKLDLAKLFDVFTFELSDREMYDEMC